MERSLDDGGYNYNFVNPPPDRLLCNICQFPCREAQQTSECGHLYCKSCINMFISSATVNHACPVCRKEPFTIFPQLRDDREIKTQKVYCPNKSDGCAWIGELASIIDHKHSQKCVPCDKCNATIHYKDISNHLATCPCYCPYCNITADRKVIGSEHKEKCHKFLLTCPNKCGQDRIPRDDMDEHKKVCPLEIIQCEYQCGAMIARNEVDQHNKEKMTEHIRLTFQATKTTTIILSQLHNDIRALRNDVPFSNLHKDVVEVHENVSNLHQEFHKEFSELRKECKGISRQGAELEIAKRQDNMLVSLIRSHLTVIVLCVIVAILLQSYFTITPDLDDTQPELVEKTPLDGTWQPKLVEKSKCIDAQPLVKFTQTERHLLSLSESVIHGDESLWSLILFVTSEMLDQVAPAILKMVDFAKSRQMKEDWYSEPFLAFNEGYQVCLRVYADGFGDGKGTHLSVFLHLMKGAHDDNLEQSGHWPLRGTFVIELLNQLSDKDHHSQKIVFNTHTDDDNTKRVIKGNRAIAGWGFHQFISFSTLSDNNDNGYVKSDTLYFRVTYTQYAQRHKQEKLVTKADEVEVSSNSKVLASFFIVLVFVLICNYYCTA